MEWLEGMVSLLELGSVAALVASSGRSFYRRSLFQSPPHPIMLSLRHHSFYRAPRAPSTRVFLLPRLPGYVRVAVSDASPLIYVNLVA